MPLPFPNLEGSNALAALLSLDLTKPFWPELELVAVVPDVEAFQALVRRTVLRSRARYEALPTDVPNVLVEIVEALAGMSRPEAEALLSWTRRAYLGSHSEQPSLSAWEIVLVQCAYANAPEIDDPAVVALAAWATAYRERVLAQDLGPRIDALRAAPLSAWDFEMFARHGYSEQAFNHPLDRIVGMAGVFAMLGTWDEVRPGWTKDHREAAIEAGSAILRRLGVWMPQDPLTLLDE